jgi:hypothetical protein
MLAKGGEGKAGLPDIRIDMGGFVAVELVSAAGGTLSVDIKVMRQR